MERSAIFVYIDIPHSQCTDRSHPFVHRERERTIALRQWQGGGLSVIPTVGYSRLLLFTSSRSIPGLACSAFGTSRFQAISSSFQIPSFLPPLPTLALKLRHGLVNSREQCIAPAHGDLKSHLAIGIRSSALARSANANLQPSPALGCLASKVPRAPHPVPPPILLFPGDQQSLRDFCNALLLWTLCALYATCAARHCTSLLNYRHRFSRLGEATTPVSRE